MRPSVLRPGHPYLAGAPLLVAHRGGAGLAPENTLEAFAEALERWDADVLELDVRATREGHVVVIHDATVDRTTDGRGAVADLSLPDLRALDAGARFLDPDGRASFAGRGVRVPLLEEVLEAFPHARLNVEIKDRAAGAGTLALVRRFGATDRVLVAAAEEPDRREARAHRGPWGASRRQLAAFLALHRTPLHVSVPLRADAFQVPVRWRGVPICTEAFVRRAHERNVPVHVWTVDEPDEMRRLLALGVDGIQSDRPDRLARVLVEETGRPLPPGLREAGGRG